MIERTVEVAGHGGPVSLAVAEAGAGGRPLLLVHGFTGAKEDFTEWLDPLAELGWHAVAPDQRGHGDSSQPPDEAPYSFDAFAADVLGLLDVLGWDRCGLLGHSMGGHGRPDRGAAGAAPLRQPRADGHLAPRAARRSRASSSSVWPSPANEGIAAVMAAQDALGSEDALGTPAHERVLATRPGYREFGQRKMLASSPAMYVAMLTGHHGPRGPSTGCRASRPSSSPRSCSSATRTSRS